MRLPRHSVLSCCLQAVEYANCGEPVQPGLRESGLSDSMGFSLDDAPARRVGLVRDGRLSVQGLADPLPDGDPALRELDTPGFVYVESGRGSWFWRHWNQDGSAPFTGRPRHHFSGRLEARLVARSGIWDRAESAGASQLSALALGERCTAMLDGTTPDLATFHFCTVSGCCLRVPRPFSVQQFGTDGAPSIPTAGVPGEEHERDNWLARALWLIRGSAHARNMGEHPEANPEPETAEQEQRNAETAHDCAAVRRARRPHRNGFPCRLYLTLERTE